MKRFKGPLLILLSSLLYGSYGIWSVMLGKDFGVFFQGYVRAGIIVLFLLPICYWTKSWRRIEKEDIRSYWVVIFFACLAQTPIYYAYLHAGIGITSLVLFSFVLFTSFFFGKIFLRERITLVRWVSLALGCGGLFLIFFYSFGTYDFLAIFMAALGGVAVGGMTSASKLIPKKFSALQTSIIIWTSSFLASFSLSLLFHEQQIIPAWNIHWLAMMIFATAGLLAFYCVIEGYKYVEASIGGLIGLLEVVFGVLFGAIFYGEPLTLTIVFGTVLILSSAALPNFQTIRRTEPPAAS